MKSKFGQTWHIYVDKHNRIPLIEAILIQVCGLVRIEALEHSTWMKSHMMILYNYEYQEINCRGARKDANENSHELLWSDGQQWFRFRILENSIP